MVDSLNSTRKSSPTYVLKRPIQGISLDDLLTATAEDLLESVVTTLKDHSQRYASHLDQQKHLYSSYIKTMAKSQVSTLSAKAVTKSCVKATSCKQPATFQAHSNRLDIDKQLEQQALDTRKHASEYFLTMVDSRVCTQTAVSLSRINSVVCLLSHAVMSNTQYIALLDLAWSCLVFLWEHLKLIITYPLIKPFLRQASEALAPIISGNTTTMDRLLALFESDHLSIVFLCHTFQYNQHQHSKTIQLYQRITCLLVSVQKASSSSVLSQQLPALEYLIGSFDIDTWTSSDTAKDETKRQAFYLAACDFIRHQDDWHQEHGNNNADDGMDCFSLVTIVIAQMMSVMKTYVRKQKGSTQGEHLYVLHLLLDSLATTYKKHNINTSSMIGFTRALDTLIDVLSHQHAKTMIITQQQWKQQNRPAMQLEWTLLDDPRQTLETLHTIHAQIYTSTENQLQDVFNVYGPSGCIELARLMLGLLLDSRVERDFGLVVRCFELFWKLSHGNNDKITIRKSSEQTICNHTTTTTTTTTTTDARLYIIQLFGLSLELILDDQYKNTIALQNTLNDIHWYFYETLLHQLDTSWIDMFLPTLTDLPWNHLSQHSDIMETILATCIRLRKDSQPKYNAYSTLVYSILQHTIIERHQQHVLSPLDHCQFLQYVKLSFLLLLTAEWIWPDARTRTENLEKLWGPIVNESGKLKADDMNMVIEITGIDNPSSWQSSLENQEKGGTLDDSSSGDQDTLSVCIRWVRHLTIVDGDAGSMKLVGVFGRFILVHLKKVDSIDVQMNWLKVLLDQADEYMTKHDTLLEFNDCIDWFRVLVRTLLDRYRPIDDGTSTDIETVMETICEAIDISNYSTTLAMFTACIPPSSTSPTHSMESLTYINFRLKVMERCLEHCLQLQHADDVWLRVGTLLHDIYMNNNNNNNMEAATQMMEASITEYIRHSMDLSFFLVLNAFCHAKLQEPYSATNNGNEMATNNDHHVAEEIAAILSMTQVGDDGGERHVQQARKRMVLIRLFAHLLSRNKEQQNSLDLWLASVVSLARTCTRWSTSANHMAENEQAGKDGLGKYHGEGWPTWNALAATLECFLASRLAMIGIPPYSGMIPKDNSTSKMAPWITILEQKKKKDPSHKNLFKFAAGAIRDLDHWALWELEDFILQLDGLSFGSV